MSKKLFIYPEEKHIVKYDSKCSTGLEWDCDEFRGIIFDKLNTSLPYGYQMVKHSGSYFRNSVNKNRLPSGVSLEVVHSVKEYCENPEKYPLFKTEDSFIPTDISMDYPHMDENGYYRIKYIYNIIRKDGCMIENYTKTITSDDSKVGIGLYSLDISSDFYDKFNLHYILSPKVLYYYKQGEHKLTCSISDEKIENYEIVCCKPIPKNCKLSNGKSSVLLTYRNTSDIITDSKYNFGVCDNGLYDKVRKLTV